MGPKQRAALKKLFGPRIDKTSLLLWNKNLLTEIYRNIQTFAIQVLCGNPERVQCKCFFWLQPKACLLENW